MTNTPREDFADAEAELAWLKKTATDDHDYARIVGYEDCLRKWQAAASHYLPVIEKARSALHRVKSQGLIGHITEEAVTEALQEIDKLTEGR